MCMCCAMCMSDLDWRHWRQTPDQLLDGSELAIYSGGALLSTGTALAHNSTHWQRRAMLSLPGIAGIIIIAEQMHRNFQCTVGYEYKPSLSDRLLYAVLKSSNSCHRINIKIALQ